MISSEQRKKKTKLKKELKVYRVPSRKKPKKEMERLNLIPILDAVFIFIFFLLMSANFIQVFEINSNIPIVSNAPVPKNKKPPLGLTIDIRRNAISVKVGLPARTVKTISKGADGFYDLESLHTYLIQLKKVNKTERTVLFEPKIDLTYDELIKIMDSVRMFRTTDEAVYTKDKDSIDVKVKVLFDDIIFGNIAS